MLKENKERVWLDRICAGWTKDFRRVIEEDIAQGYQFVVSDKAIDIVWFVKDPFWFKTLVKNESIVIEVEEAFDEIVSKDFYWLSFNQFTHSGKNFMNVVKNGLDISREKEEMLFSVAETIKEYGIPLGHWKKGECKPFNTLWNREKFGWIPFSQDYTYTRSEIWREALKFPWVLMYWGEYQNMYVAERAKLHNCKYILDGKGALDEVK